MTQPAAMSAQQRNQLRRTFRKDLKGPVTLRLFTRAPSPIAIPGHECPTCDRTQQLIEEVAAASTKIDLEVHDFFAEAEAARRWSVSRIPAILVGNDDPPRTAFYGIPLGCQMAVIVETIRSLSRGVSSLKNDSRRRLRAVDRPVRMQILVTPEEQASAEAAYLGFSLARENANISAEVVQLRDFPALARSLAVQSVPLVILNGLHRIAGPVTEDGLVNGVILAAGAETS